MFPLLNSRTGFVDPATVPPETAAKRRQSLQTAALDRARSKVLFYGLRSEIEWNFYAAADYECARQSMMAPWSDLYALGV